VKTIGLATLLLIAALLLPPFNVPRSSFDYIVVFDISQSMNVEDYALDGKPVSRLVYAREAARRALRNLPCGSRVGWAAFAEYRTLMLLAPVEVCRNYDDLLASLANIDGGMRW
jgi:mxaL protein